MTFGADQIRPAGGKIWAHLFENPQVGLARDLFWGIDIDCADITLEGEPWPCSLACEWLRVPARHWRDLDGFRLSASDQFVEASIYLYAAHRWMRGVALSLDRIEQTASFRVALSGIIDLSDEASVFGIAQLPVELTTTAQFSGIVVVPDDQPDLATPEGATAALARFYDTASLELPVWNNFRYDFAPRGNDAGV